MPGLVLSEQLNHAICRVIPRNNTGDAVGAMLAGTEIRSVFLAMIGFMWYMTPEATFTMSGVLPT